MKELGLARYGRVCGARHLPSHPNFARGVGSCHLARTAISSPLQSLLVVLVGAWSFTHLMRLNECPRKLYEH